MAVHKLDDSRVKMIRFDSQAMIAYSLGETAAAVSVLLSCCANRDLRRAAMRFLAWVSAALPLAIMCSAAWAQGGIPPVPSVEAAGWRFARSQTAGGGSAVSIMRTVDPLRSDFEIAGLMFRCAEGGTDAVVIMLTPFKPDARPKVAIDLGGVRVDIEASVLPSGAGVLIPRELMSVFTAREKATADLRVEVGVGAKPLVGVIGKLYAAPALRRLQAQCSPS